MNWTGIVLVGGTDGHGPQKKKKRRRSSSSNDSDSEPPTKRGRPSKSHSSSPDFGPPPPPPPPPPSSSLLSHPTHRPFSFLKPLEPSSKAKSSGGGLATYLRCAPCGIECSGKPAFLQHLCGRAHQKGNGGRTGFAGLAPNSMGRIPALINMGLRAAAARIGHDPDGSATGERAAELPAQPWMPPSRTVVISAVAEDQLRRALQRTAALSTSAPAAGPRTDELFSRMDTNRPLLNRHPLGGTVPSSADCAASRPLPDPPPGQRRRQIPHRPPPPPAVVPHGGPFAAARQALPVAGSRAELLTALREPACVVEGETGSGKTTQIPQFLLEGAAARGESIHVICTQPRRISAIGVADRVAAERGERVGTGAVGYAVRGESRQCSETCLLFCTTGVSMRAPGSPLGTLLLL